MTRRITMGILSLVVLVLVVVGFLTFGLARASLRQDTLKRMERQTEVVANLLPALNAVDEEDRPNAERINRTRARITGVLNTTGITQVVIDPEGRLVGDLPTPVRPRALDIAELQANGVQSGGIGSKLWAASGRQVADGSTLVAVLVEPREPLFGTTLRYYLLAAAASVLLALFAARALSKRLTRPILEAVSATESMAKGDLSVRLPTHESSSGSDGPDELETLKRSINIMAEGLQRSQGLEQQFLVSVTHDLRTPLTSIRGYAEAIADGVTPHPAAAGATILAEAKKLERLVGDILDLARLSARQFRLNPSKVDVSTLLEAAYRSLNPGATAAGLQLKLNAPSDLYVWVDSDRALQVIGNLTANAVRYATTTIWMTARQEPGGFVAIDVADDGAGISPEDLPYLFERLYQAHNQPVRQESGAGIGLAIVRELCLAMGGSASVASQLGTGTTVTARFPAADS